MKGFLRSNTFKIFLLVSLVLLTITTLSQTVGDVSLANVFNIVTAPMQESLTSLNEQEELQYSKMSREELEKYCSEIALENDELRAKLVSYYELKQENDLYKEALEYREQKPEMKFVPAIIIARDSSDTAKGFTINIGTSNGISKGDCVITASGLVGIISDVNTMSAQVETIFSQDLSVGATSKEFRENGVISGDAELSVNNFVKLEYLNKATKLEQGTIITTTGTSGNYPKGIIVGSVEEVRSSANDISMYAVVKPYVDIENISSVFVVTDFTADTNTTKGED